MPYDFSDAAKMTNEQLGLSEKCRCHRFYKHQNSYNFCPDCGRDLRDDSERDERLPGAFVVENLAASKNATFLGIPIKDLSKDELIAVVVELGNETNSMMEVHRREVNFLKSLTPKVNKL